MCSKGQGLGSWKGVTGTGGACAQAGRQGGAGNGGGGPGDVPSKLKLRKLKLTQLGFLPQRGGPGQVWKRK